MKHVTLLPLNLQYAETIFTLSSDAHVKNALGIKIETVEDTKSFIHFAMEEERKRQSLSRVISNEKEEIIGITTLKHIDYKKRHLISVAGLDIPIGDKGTTKLLKRKFLKSHLKN